MAKTKSKPARSNKQKKPRAEALRATTASVRRKKTASVLKKENGARKNSAGSGHIAADDFGRSPLAGLGPISRTLNACIEFQARLLKCRTPFDVWRVQSLFAARLISLSLGQQTDQTGFRRKQT
jgi:hypothetical protein